MTPRSPGDPRSPSGRSVAATAILVAAGYWLGANIGFILRLPPSIPSVVWPPNSILTATLLLAAPRRWWIYLLAAFPAHLLAELPNIGPVPLVLALFATNCSEALIAALCVRLFSDAPGRLDTLRRVVVFIAGAALLAPFLSSFADAAVVTAFRREAYWTVWRTRIFSNILTELTVASAILTVASALRDKGEAPYLRQRKEGALLALLLAAGALVVFTVGGPDSMAANGSPGSPFAWLLPFLLWAAVRFAPLGASLSLLLTTLVAIWAASRGLGPFTGSPVSDQVLPLQLLLSVLAIPLMCLAALTEERRKAQSALAERLRFEEFLARLSAAFVHLPSHEVDRAIAGSLEKLGEFLRLDRVLLLRFPAGEGGLAVSHAWAAPGHQALPATVVGREHPAAAERLRLEGPFLFSRSLERGALAGADVRTSVTLPLVATRRVIGGLSLETISAERIWPEKLLPRLQLVAEVFANALDRKEGEDALRASRQELAHVARVSMMGELTASLAHELSQPLTGILANAQAARRFLLADPLPLEELRATVQDIIADDRRAADVIHRLRDLLRKGELRQARLDLNDLIGDVTRLLGSDAVIRSTTVVLELDSSPVVVSGDRVQLEQVMLNLLVNAMDAMAEVSEGERTIVVRTRNAERAQVAVQDAGTGLSDGTEARIFEPFYTTKEAGMGMGLSIARSIIEAHGGSIWATNNQSRGATVHFALPRMESA